ETAFELILFGLVPLFLTLATVWILWHFLEKIDPDEVTRHSGIRNHRSRTSLASSQSALFEYGEQHPVAPCQFSGVGFRKHFSDPLPQKQVYRRFHERRSAADRGEYCEAAGAAAKILNDARLT